MKKLAILILVVISLFSMVACDGNKDINRGISIEPDDTAEAGPYVNYDYKDKDARDEEIYRKQYVLRLSEEPEELAEFLFSAGELDEFVEVDAKDQIEYAAEVFQKDEDIHQKALERAKEVFANTHIDCNWRKIALRSDDSEEHKAYMEQNNPILPLATDARTGKPISNEPAGPWDGPTD